MVVDYAEWGRFERQQAVEIVQKSIERVAKGGKVTPLSMVPEIGLKEEDSYTLWLLPGLFGVSTGPLTSSLANLLTTYQKVILPIPVFDTKSDFESACLLSTEALTGILERNKDNYIPVIGAAPEIYRQRTFYEPIFETCRRLYGNYPPFASYRIDQLQVAQALSTIATLNGISGIDWVKDVERRFPETRMEYVRNVEVPDLVGNSLRPMLELSSARGTTVDNVKSEMATCIMNLRTYGHVELARFLLRSYYPKYKNIMHLYELLNCYQSYLIRPLNGCLGGFANYTTEDLELMAFLRVLPFEKEQLRRLDRENMRLLMNSPAARSSITEDEFKMRVFLRGGNDVNMLNSLSEFAERHKKEVRAMAEYKKSVASGNLSQAAQEFRAASAVFSQISEEIEGLARKEKSVKLGVYGIRGGAMFLSGVAAYLGQGLSPGWRLAIVLGTNLGLFVKDLNPKTILEWMLDAGVSPWYEKGTPYLYWKTLDRNRPHEEPGLDGSNRQHSY